MAGILDMILKGLGEMFESYSAETYAGRIPLVPMGSQVEGPACAETEARTPPVLAGYYSRAIINGSVKFP